MDYPLRYNIQLGNYLASRTGRRFIVAGISQKITVMDEKAELSELLPSQLFPLPASSVVLRACGLKPLRVQKEDFHSKIIFQLEINKKIYTIDVWEYDNKSVCIFRHFTVLYFHQLQNALKFFEPSFELKLF